MAFDILVKALFTDSGLSAGLAKANASLAGLAKSAPGGSRGLYAIERGLQTLAAEAVGIQGPIGRVAEGLLRFGGGGTLILGAAAGIGLVAEAYKFANKEAADFAATNQRLTKSWQDLVGRGKPIVGLRNEFLTALKDRTATQEELDAATALQMRPGGGARVARAQENLEMAQRVVDETRANLKRAQVQLEADASDRGVKWATKFVEGIHLLDPGAQIRSLILASRQLGDAGTEVGRIFAKQMDAAIEQQFFQREMGGARAAARAFAPLLGPGALIAPRGAKLGPGELGGEFLDLGKGPMKFAPREFFLQDLIKEGGKTPPGKADARQLAAEALALLGALKQGGAAGIFGAGAGIFSDLGGLKGASPLLGQIGIGLNIASGLFGLFDHSAERRHREEMDKLTRIIQNTDKRGQPDHISVTILLNGKEVSGALLQDVLYGIKRAERTNAVPVLPPS